MTVVARCIKTMAFKLGGKMNEQRIREIANQCSDFAEQIPYFRGIENGLTWEATIQKARDLKFAELIVRECTDLVQKYMTRWPEDCELTKQIKEHFGVEE